MGDTTPCTCRVDAWVDMALERLAQANATTKSAYMAQLLTDHVVASGEPESAQQKEQAGPSILVAQATRCLVLMPYNIRCMEVRIPDQEPLLVQADAWEDRLKLRRELLKEFGQLYGSVPKEDWYKHAFASKKEEQQQPLEVEPVLDGFFSRICQPGAATLVRSRGSRFEISSSLSDFWASNFRIAGARPSTSLLAGPIFRALLIQERQGQTILPFSKYMRVYKRHLHQRQELLEAQA